jgi:hypothetical protein
MKEISMKRSNPTTFLALAVLLLLLAVGAVVMAQSSAGFNLESYVIGGGGGESSSANYQINGTIGQSVASHPISSSDSFRVSSGYWHADTKTYIYLPTLLKN